jgi:hypothetical protein
MRKCPGHRGELSRVALLLAIVPIVVLELVLVSVKADEALILTPTTLPFLLVERPLEPGRIRRIPR